MEFCEISNNRQTEARSRRSLIGADTALQHQITLGGLQAWTVVVNRNEKIGTFL